MIKKILVAIDGSKPSIRALDYALDLAEKLDAEVVLLSVIPHVLYPTFSEEDIDEEESETIITPGEMDRFLSKLRSNYQNVLRTGRRRSHNRKPSVKVSTKLVEGQPADMIVETAKKGGFDLIVMGSRGLSGLTEFFLGSVTRRVANLCTCPLLIIK